MIFYIQCEYETHVGDRQDDGDGSPYSGFDHEVMDNHRFTISKVKPDYPDQTYTTELDKAYVVAVIYGDGGTFGRTDGYVQYLGPFSKEKAEEVMSLIDSTKDKIWHTKEQTKFKENTDRLKSLMKEYNKYFYANWTGYFASFEGMYLLCSDGTVEEQ